MHRFRVSIAGLMCLVLFAAIASAGVADPLGPWAGILALFTRAVLSMALVGALCRTGPERAWWLGFASFGWIYLGLPIPFSRYRSQMLPTESVIELLWNLLGTSAVAMRDHPESEMWSSSHEIARDVWSLLAAIIGGLLARGVFGTAIKQQEETAPGTQPAIPGSLPWWGLIAVVVLTGLVLLAWTIVGGATRT